MFDLEYLEKVAFDKNTANIFHMIKRYLSFKIIEFFLENS